ncbi:MAG: lysylphosphatidylglycerol synthase transmembrane domain-containing protein [Anaerolineales bacterium]|jgi:uncharacterized protein (TIRG00374 family)
MRKFFIALVILLGVIFIIARIAEVEAILETLQRGKWWVLTIALGVEGLWLVNVAASFQAIFKALGIKEKLSYLLVMASAANFVNVVTPSAGMGGMAIFISESQRRDYSAGRATAAGALYVLYDYAGFICILSLGLIVLFRRNNLNITEVIASIILVTIAVIIATLLYHGTRSAESLGNALAWIARQINKILKPFLNREYLSEQRAHDFARDAADGLSQLRRNPANLIMPAFLALSNKIILIIVLYLMFLAFEVDTSIGTLIAGFSISYLFMIVSPTPSGVGFVEGALTLALHSFFIPLGPSAVIALSYRGFTFWIPLVFGMIAFRWLGKPTPEHERLPIDTTDFMN